MKCNIVVCFIGYNKMLVSVVVVEFHWNKQTKFLKTTKIISCMSLHHWQQSTAVNIRNHYRYFYQWSRLFSTTKNRIHQFEYGWREKKKKRKRIKQNITKKYMKHTKVKINHRAARKTWIINTQFSSSLKEQTI